MKTKYKIQTNDLLALIHIIDSYQGLNQNVKKAIDSKNKKKFISKLNKISNGKFSLDYNARKFYKKNKETIDIINNYSSIQHFIHYNYNTNGKSKESLDYLYLYILKHKENINEIIANVEKLQRLGFEHICFDEQLDFTMDTYKAYPNIKQNSYITYVANPTVIPTYSDDIHYKSNNTNYKMEFKIITETTPFIAEKIYLNSLLFDTSTFPKEINKASIFNPLLDAKKELKKIKKLIKNSINLSVGVLDLESQLNTTMSTINNLDSISSKKELIEILTRIKSDLNLLKELDNNYTEEISDKNEELNKDLLEQEKIRYLNRRNNWY